MSSWFVSHIWTGVCMFVRDKVTKLLRTRFEQYWFGDTSHAYTQRRSTAYRVQRTINERKRKIKSTKNWAIISRQTLALHPRKYDRAAGTDGDVNTKQLITVKSRSVRAPDSREMTTSLNLDKCHLDLLRVRHMFDRLLQSSRDFIAACIVSCCRPHWSFIHHSSSQQLPAQALKDRMKIQPKYLTFFCRWSIWLIRSWDRTIYNENIRRKKYNGSLHLKSCSFSWYGNFDSMLSYFFAHIWHW